ncbi:isoamyl acetate-hydrolyzing esterase [Microbotryomycetes sp. JL201]|nr:isoamyl acetate-hydrolyzing esterase [Microbotryomycetes sp. JL201]
MAEPSFQPDTVIMFGGSFATGGTGAALADLYQRVFDVKNRGYGGYNTRIALPIAQKWLPKQAEDRPRTALMTIWFGANDAVFEGQLQHVPLAEFKLNLQRMIDLLQNPVSPHHSPTTKLLLITPPAILASKWANFVSQTSGVQTSPDRSVEHTQQYVEAVKQVGLDRNVPVADVWEAMYEEAKENDMALDDMLYDGLHLTAKGYAIATEAIKATIATAYPELHWEKQTRLFPEWRTLLV